MRDIELGCVVESKKVGTNWVNQYIKLTIRVRYKVGQLWILYTSKGL